MDPLSRNSSLIYNSNLLLCVEKQREYYIIRTPEGNVVKNRPTSFWRVEEVTEVTATNKQTLVTDQKPVGATQSISLNAIYLK